MPNHHITKPVLIGEVQDNGQFDIVWQTPSTVAGDAWSDYLPGSRDLISDWRKPMECGNFNVVNGSCGGSTAAEEAEAAMPNHHITKPVLIGEVQDNGQFDIVWQTPSTVAGDAWSDYLPGSRDLISDWRKPMECGNFNVVNGSCGGSTAAEEAEAALAE